MSLCYYVVQLCKGTPGNSQLKAGLQKNGNLKVSDKQNIQSALLHK